MIWGEKTKNTPKCIGGRPKTQKDFRENPKGP